MVATAQSTLTDFLLVFNIVHKNPRVTIPIIYEYSKDQKTPYQLFASINDIISEKLDLFKVGTLTFEKPDTDTFRCLPLCIKAINEGGILPTVVNGANEEAVRLFLDGKCEFLQIAELVEKALNSVNNIKDFTLDDIFAADSLAREIVRKGD